MSDTYDNKVRSDSNATADRIIAALPDFSRKFFNSIRLTKSPRTRAQYAYDMQRFFTWLFEQAGFKECNHVTVQAKDIFDALTPDDIQEYISYLSVSKDGKTRSMPFIARNLATLKSFINHYILLGETTSNLSTFIKMPKIHDKEIKTLDSDQVQRMIDAVYDTTGMTQKQIDSHKYSVLRDTAILTLFFTTGMRVSELVGIDLNDIDFKDGTLLVTRKGGDQDTVYLSRTALESILSYVSDERNKYSSDEETALFLSQKRSRLSVKSVERLIAKYAKLAGVNVKVTPHTLRRTFGTNLYNKTGDIYLVADVLHHASVETTKKHYAKISENHKKIAAEVADELYRKK